MPLGRACPVALARALQTALGLQPDDLDWEYSGPSST